MQLALVSMPGEVLEAYNHFFAEKGAQLIHFSSVSELYRKLPDIVISGFIVDIPTLLKATETEKFFLQSIEEIFPNVRITRNPQMGFRAVFYGSDKSGEESLSEFLEKCRNFSPRALRKDKRKTKHLNVLFWLNGTSEETAQRAYTLGISRGGVFVCTCEPPPVDTVVSVKLLELDEQPFKVVVKWQLPWGIAMRIPGFGGSFVDLHDDQAKQLDASLI